MIRHFLKDGTQVNSVEGIVITMEQFPEIYRLFDRINQKIVEGRDERDETVRTSDRSS